MRALEVERAAWGRRGVEWKLVVGSDVARAERLNMQERATWAFLGGVNSPNEVGWDEVADVMLVELADAATGRIVDLCKAAERRQGWVAGTALSALKRLRARNLVEIAGAARLDPFGPVTQLVLVGEG